MRKILLLVTAALLLATVPGAWADVQIYSSAGQTVHLNRNSGIAGFTVPGDFTTVAIAPVGAWALESETGVPGSKWISFTTTGSGGSSPSNDSGTPLATFLNTFTLPAIAGRYQGYLNVWADDTTAVRIIPPGTELFPPSIPSGSACAASPIGCLGGAGGTGASIFLDLAPGDYTLAFDTYQIAGDGFGVLYGANLTAVPEPTSLLLFGTAILGVTGLIRRRMR